jgi:hypothetical protein
MRGSRYRRIAIDGLSRLGPDLCGCFLKSERLLEIRTAMLLSNLSGRARRRAACSSFAMIRVKRGQRRDGNDFVPARPFAK